LLFPRRPLAFAQTATLVWNGYCWEDDPMATYNDSVALLLGMNLERTTHRRWPWLPESD